MSVQRRLSQTMGALKKGFRVDNAFEGFPITQTMMNVSEISDTAVLGATTLASGVYTTVSGSITHPDCYRAVKIKGNASGITGVVTITGADRGGKVVTDRITASGAGAVDGTVPMAKVYTISLPPRNAPGDTISVGRSNKLGLYRPLESSADVVLTERKATASSSFTVEANGVINSMYGTVTPSGVITNNDSFIFHYFTKIF